MTIDLSNPDVAEGLAQALMDVKQGIEPRPVSADVDTRRYLPNRELVGLLRIGDRIRYPRRHDVVGTITQLPDKTNGLYFKVDRWIGPRSELVSASFHINSRMGKSIELE